MEGIEAGAALGDADSPLAGGSPPERRLTLRTATVALAATLLAGAAGAQPFQGTAFMSPRILTAADPSALRSVEYAGRGERVIWDHRVMDWITVDAYLFNARAAARVEVDAYAADIGRLPAVLLSNLAKVHVNASRPAQSGGGNPPPAGPARSTDGMGSLRRSCSTRAPTCRSTEPWSTTPPGTPPSRRTARSFRTTPATTPTARAVAESILPYFAVWFRAERLGPGQRQAIGEAIPARLEYFDAQGFDGSPYMPAVPALPTAAVALLAAGLVAISRRPR